MQTWIDKLSRKFSPLAIPSLMKYIVLTMGTVFMLDLIYEGLATSYLIFDTAAIMNGEVWRVISFILLPPASSMIFILFVLYFYWMIGETLEEEWGAPRFCLYYLIGIVGTIAAGLITGYASNFYLNMSLLFAFAILFPNFEIRLFFILPIKVKWLAWLDAAFFIYWMIVADWPGRIALLVSVANVALFFWKDAKNRIVNLRRRKQWRDNFR